MNIQEVPLAQIEVGDRLRAIDEDYAALIAQSIKARGQMTPVEVRQNGEDGFILVSGGHRYRAAQLLQAETITASVVDCDDFEAELREIDENLFRRDLSELDRGAFFHRRKELEEQLAKVQKHGGDRVSDQAAKFGDLQSFTALAAEKLRISERSVQRTLQRFTKLAPDVRAKIAGTWLADHGAQLDALIKANPTEQRKVVALMFREREPFGDVASALREVRGVKDEEGLPPDTVAANRILTAWRKASPAAQEVAFKAIQAEQRKRQRRDAGEA